MTYLGSVLEVFLTGTTDGWTWEVKERENAFISIQKMLATTYNKSIIHKNKT